MSPARPQHSLSRRLTLLFALSAALLLTSLMGTTYWLLDREFREDENRVLQDTATLLQTVFGQNEDLVQTLKRDLPLDLEAFHFNRYQLRILNEGGEVIYETQRFPDVGADFLGPAQVGHTRSWQRGKDSYLVLQAYAPRQRGSAERVRLLVALDTSQKTRTLSEYRQLLILLVIAGVALSAFGAATVSKRGLKPLRVMTEMVENLRADQLETRFATADWPLELQPLAQHFDRLLDEIQHGMARLTHFSTDLAHELRTPLTSLLLEAEVTLSQPRSPQDYQRVLASSMEELERLGQLVERLLLLAGTEASTLRLQPVLIHPLVDRLVDYHLPEGTEAHIDIPADAVLQGDARLLELALGNLLSNAVRYGAPPLRIGWKADGEGVCITVEDGGQGISPEHLPYVFERLYRADPSRHSGGHGLGLALVRSAMRAHGGEVRLHSEPGKGCRFELRFPDNPQEDRWRCSTVQAYDEESRAARL